MLFKECNNKVADKNWTRGSSSQFMQCTLQEDGAFLTDTMTPFL